VAALFYPELRRAERAGFRRKGTEAKAEASGKGHSQSTQENKMSTNTQPPLPKKKWLSLDTWAVLIALAAALLIRAGVLPHVPW
jgi:hypothetical protein